MPESKVLDRLAALNATINEVAIIPGMDDGALEELEAVKRGLDDARLGLWGKLQGIHEGDAKAYSERFRIRRASEICNRLTDDLKLGLMPADHPELADLWIVVNGLAEAIQRGRGGSGVGD